MKTICAWCGSTISVNCDHCGAPLLEANTQGSTWRTFGQNNMVCLNGLTPMIYSEEAIDRMPLSHGLCKRCSQLPEEERASLIEKRRQADRSLPSAQDLDTIVAEREGSELHEQATRRANRAAIHFTAHKLPEPKHRAIDHLPHERPAKKRGPTPIPEAPETSREKP
jgi:hypothetical protein